MLLDEIDKVSNDYKSDTASALLSIRQRAEFTFYGSLYRNACRFYLGIIYSNG